MDATPVLLLLESFGRGGAERVVLNTVAAMDRTRFQPEVVHLFAPDGLAEECRALGVEVRGLGLRGPEDLVKGILAVRRMLRARPGAVVHTHLFFANVVGRLASLGTDARVVTTLHNPDYGQEAHGGLRFRVRVALDRLSHMLNPGTVLAVSEEVRRDYVREMAYGGIRVLPNYMDIAPFQARVAAQDRRALRAAHGVPDDAVVVLHVGRFHRQKAQDVLVEAAILAREAAPALRVVFLGRDADASGLPERVATAGAEDTVRFEGLVEDPLPWYALADAFAFPSRYEAFGVALLEAMAAGLPSVVSTVGGIDEVATSQTSLFVAPDDAEGLAEALVRLTTDAGLRARLGAAARERARVFDAGPVLERLEAIYDGA
ncbi:MAG: glycosyltransferase [Longimicrobiales bacterium]